MDHLIDEECQQDESAESDV